MDKTLLVLAASLYQVDVILTAQRLGYTVVTTDNVPSNPGHALADRCFTVDTTDYVAVLELAEREEISGIIAAGTDVAVVTAAVVCQQLGLPGPSIQAADVLTNKLEFRRFLKEHGFPCPSARLIDDEMDLPIDQFAGRKCIVKPCRSSGSKGVFILQDVDDFVERAAESRSFSLDNKAVIEEYVEGSQHTCEGILQRGSIVLALITDRETAQPPYTTTIGHRVPSTLAPSQQNEALCAIQSVLNLLGVHDGPFDCDFIASADGIYLIEISPRLGGNSMTHLFRAAYDYDLIAYATQHACGDTVEVPQTPLVKPSAVILLGTSRAGSLFWDQAEADVLRREHWVDSFVIDYPLSSSVQPFTNGRHRVGAALITAATRAELDARVAEFRTRLDIKVT